MRIALTAVLLGGLGGLAAAAAEPAASMKLTSTAFKHEASMPSRYTCDGGNVSPPLAWASAPAGTKSFALIVTDPDAPDPKAPKTTWVHWVLYDIPADTASLREAIPSKGLPAGTLEGVSDWGRTGYGGPCPPIGRHRYVHTLYALDVVLRDLDKPTRARLLAAMEGHVLASAELIGTYQRQ
jgi:Raf kinase inhibitor-like YbhB/YbcL family protein